MKKTKHWLVNVFWYHYKLHFFGALLVLFLAHSFATQVLFRPADDFVLVFASAHYIDSRDVDPIRDAVAQALGQEKGGSANVAVWALQLDQDELSYLPNRTKLFNAAGGALPTLLVMDADSYGRYAEHLGLEIDAAAPVDLRETALFKTGGLDSHSYYACLRNGQPAETRTAEEQAVAAIKG